VFPQGPMCFRLHTGSYVIFSLLNCNFADLLTPVLIFFGPTLYDAFFSSFVCAHLFDLHLYELLALHVRFSVVSVALVAFISLYQP